MKCLLHLRTLNPFLRRSTQLIPSASMAINYLYLAPNIAGGNRKKAKRLIDELKNIDPIAAYRTRLDIASQETDADTIITLLNEREIRSPDELADRMILIRKLIISVEKYYAADIELTTWDKVNLSEEIEVERLFLRGVLWVYGSFEYEIAEQFLSEFVARRDSLDADAMESISVGYSFLGDARRMQGNIVGAREAYEAARR